MKIAKVIDLIYNRVYTMEELLPIYTEYARENEIEATLEEALNEMQRDGEIKIIYE